MVMMFNFNFARMYLSVIRPVLFVCYLVRFSPGISPVLEYLTLLLLSSITIIVIN